MDKQTSNRATQIFESLHSFLRRCVFSVLSMGPMPQHIAFIMDGNRRYAKKKNLEEGSGHRAGYVALMNMLRFCYELNVKYVTIYAFSIDNFKRRPEEVQSTMKLIQEKIESLIAEESLVNFYGVRVYFIGNLELLSKSVRSAAEKIMNSTSKNSKAVLSICIAYTSTDEIFHSIGEACKEKRTELNGFDKSSKRADYDDASVISVTDVEKRMYMSVAPDPDIIVRTSGETRLSNFLLWQSAHSLLYSPKILWPEIGFRHLVGAIMDFQRNISYLERKRKQG